MVSATRLHAPCLQSPDRRRQIPYPWRQVRAVLDAREDLRSDSLLSKADKRLLALDQDTEVTVLTSRSNLVHQLITQGPSTPNNDNGSSDPEAAELDDDEELKMGDIRRWVQDVILDDYLRVVVGSATRSEREKDACLTMQTYQGTTPCRIQEIHHKRRCRRPSRRIPQPHRAKRSRHPTGVSRSPTAGHERHPPGARSRSFRHL